MLRLLKILWTVSLDIFIKWKFNFTPFYILQLKENYRDREIINTMKCKSKKGVKETERDKLGQKPPSSIFKSDSKT